MPAAPFTLQLDINQDPDAMINLIAENEALVINVSDILSKTFDPTNKHICTGIILKPTTLAHKFYLRGTTPFKTKTSGKSGNAGMTYDIDIPVFLYGRTPANALLVTSLSQDSRVVVITKQAAQIGTSAYRVMNGLEAGLTVDVPTIDTSATDGGYSLTLKAVNNSKIDYFLWAATEAATQTLENVLKVPAV